MPSHDQAALLELLDGFPPDPLRLVLEATAKRMASMPEGEALRTLIADLPRVKLLAAALPDVQARRIRRFMIEVAAQVACDSVALLPAHLRAVPPEPEPEVAPVAPPPPPSTGKRVTVRHNKSGGGRVSLRKSSGEMRALKVATARHARPAPSPEPIAGPLRPSAPPRTPAAGVSLRQIPPSRLAAGVGLVLTIALLLWTVPFRDMAASIFGESHPEWFTGD